MSDATIQGTCEDCGKKYRVPSADKTYSCKACGGTVRVAAAPAKRPARAAAGAGAKRDATRAKRTETDDGDEEERPRYQRRTRSSSKTGWILLIVLLVVSTAGFGAWKTGLLAKAAGGEKDLGKVTDNFQADWEDGDLGDLADYHHPDGRAEFRKRLDTIVANRGWEDAFPAISQKTERVTGGTAEDPEKGTSILMWGDGLDSIMIDWQYEPSRTRWFAYSIKLTPSRMGPRVEAFAEAWAQSDPEALHPFFRKDAREKMAALVEKSAEKRGWSSYPKLGEAEITGEAKARDPMARMLGGSRPESVFPIVGGDGELLVKWSFRDEDDAWVVTGFKFP